MKIIIYGDNDESKKLLEKVNIAINELGLDDFVASQNSNDENLIKELNITKYPALIIEEESIEFKDMIFEGINPEIEELKSMLISIVGGGNESCGLGCDTNGCSTCHM